ncbi:tRNA (cytidine(34)-2'-O)-methyltransferase [Sulfurivirga sp.]|uniref:tRNA (cytidine(34)-2'-O)-methyltransferase n=1 Tax=Sulfurivirga sp. TaxID=2614236 RepID=UPI002600F432|nr:tRNA (cytidine(34)-2'-O)-methyltransferase [Sulfurivirga sp.]
MLHLILYEPEIPQNTGALIRLSANTGAWLHLVEPLGFDLSEKKVRRAGLDYHELARVRVHPSLDACLEAVRPTALYALTTKGRRLYTEPRYQPGTAFLFGPESRGLPDEVLARLDDAHRLRIPMREGVRSLNLANAVSVVAYEAWRQLGFQPLDG